LRTSGGRYAKTIYPKMWARKNKNRPISGFFTKIAYVQVMNFIPVEASTLYVLFRTRNLGQHFLDISKKNYVNQSLVSLINDYY
jgi:hypothetical protein